MPTQPELTLLSRIFRTKFQTLAEADRIELEKVMQVTFGLKNLRNVQLWTRPGTQTRAILNISVSPLELEARYAFVTAFINEGTPTAPQKETTMTGSTAQKGKRLRSYLFDNYTRDNLTRVTFFQGDLLYEYDAYGYGVDEIGDEISDEFDDFGA